MADTLIVQRWLIRLGRLASAAGSADDAAEFVEDRTPLLAMRFPDEAFNLRSLEHVAAECKYLPTYAELVALLRSWEASLPAPSWPAINDNVVDLSPKDRSWLAHWQRREAEGFAPLREPDGRLSRPEISNWREHTADLIRQIAPDAWAYIQRQLAAA